MTKLELRKLVDELDGLVPDPFRVKLGYELGEFEIYINDPYSTDVVLLAIEITLWKELEADETGKAIVQEKVMGALRGWLQEKLAALEGR